MTFDRLLRLFALFCFGAAAVAGAASPASATPKNVPPLELVVLGFGGPGALGRAASCHMLLVDGTPRIMVDAGPGCFVRLGESGLDVSKLDIQLLTHLHADHAGDLPGLFKARAVATRTPIYYDIFGPEGREQKGEDAYFPSTTRFIELLFGAQGAFAYLPDFVGHMSFDVKDLPAKPAPGQAPAVIYAKDDLTIRAMPGHHRDAPAVIYRIDHGGKSITFSGDMDPEGLPNLQKIAQDTSVLVFNAVVLDPPESPPVLYTLHSPPNAIGKAAQDAKVGRLVLAHLSPSTDNGRAEVMASMRKSYAGPIAFSADKMRIVP